MATSAQSFRKGSSPGPKRLLFVLVVLVFLLTLLGFGVWLTFFRQ